MRDAVRPGDLAFAGREGARRPSVVMAEKETGGQHALEAAVVAQLAVEARTQADQGIALTAAIDVGRRMRRNGGQMMFEDDARLDFIRHSSEFLRRAEHQPRLLDAAPPRSP